jgi:hypothetical protein
MTQLLLLSLLGADPVVSVVRVEQPIYSRAPKLRVVAHRDAKDVVRECPVGAAASAYVKALDKCRPTGGSSWFHVVELDGAELKLYATGPPGDMGPQRCALRPDEKAIRAEALACARTTPIVPSPPK